jgi:hypothetical protein
MPFSQHERESFMPSALHRLSTTIVALAVLAALGGCAQMQMGAQEAKTTATGSAAGANSEGANSALEKCQAPLGTLAIIEDQNAPWYGVLTGQMKLGSTVPVLKLLVQQSNCFVVVDRGRAMNAMMGERALEQSGELRKRSNFGKGQMVSADYSLSPSITFSNNNAGGLGAGLAGWGGGVFGALAGNLHMKEASTMLTVVDNRSSVQLAAAEGSARNVDFGALGSLWGNGLGGHASGYTNTAEGKVIAAAFTDAYNNVVKAVRNYKVQQVEGGLGTGGRLAVQGEDDTGKAARPAAKKKTAASD